MGSLVIDNGAGSIKVGFDNELEPSINSPNVTGNVHKSMQYMISDQVYDSRNDSQLNLTRPFDRGYLNNWQCEIDIWTYLLSRPPLRSVTPADTTLILTEPPLNPTTLQNNTNEVIFEYFGFKEYLRRPSSWFSMYEYTHNEEWNPKQFHSCMVVDTGFSFSHSIPFINRTCAKHAIRRVNIGGKLLTNYLKEIVSYRQWNMMDEFLLMNQVKENLCYVSMSFMKDLESSKNVKIHGKKRQPKANPLDSWGGKLKKKFVLPDFQRVMRGFVKEDDAPVDPDEQVLVMETERYTVPELLFNPGDIGIDQAGIAEATWQSMQCLSDLDRGIVAASIVLTGGNANIPFFKERFEAEVRPFIPSMYEVNVFLPESKPDLYAWKGAARFARQERAMGTLSKQVVTKAQFLEFGNDYCNEKFSSSW